MLLKVQIAIDGQLHHRILETQVHVSLILAGSSAFSGQKFDC